MISVKEEIEEYLRLAYSNFKLSVDVSFEYAYKGLQLIIQSNDDEYKVEYLNVLGECHLERGNLTKSLNYFKKAIELAIKQNRDSKLICKCYNFIGRVYQYRNELGKAINYYTKSLDYYLPSINAETNNNLSIIYKFQGDYRRALTYAEASLSLAKKYNKTQLPLTYSNLGNLYFKLGDKEEAIENHVKALDLSELPNLKNERHFILMQLGKLYEDLAENDKSKKYYLSALELAEKISNPIALCESKLTIGEILLRENNIHGALDQLLSAFQHAKNYDNNELKIKILTQLVSAYDELGNIDKAYNYQKELNKFLQESYKRDKYQNLNQIIEEKEVLIETLKDQNSKIYDQQNELEQRNRELQELNFAFSHYLKEPLRQINSFVGLMEKDFSEQNLNGSSSDYFAYIKEGSERIQTLLTDLVQYNTIKDQVRSERINLNEIVELARDNLRNQIIQNEAIFELDNLPTIKGNTYYIVLLFQHLINNAIKFKKENEHPYIKISYSQEVLDHLFCIEDNGIGIEKEYQRKIFTIFNRLERNAYQSTGIGLAICRKIVELHNGKIWVESEVGKGTKIYFTIRID